VLKGCFELLGARSWRVVLADCGHDERNARLHGPRAQPELATRDMDCWAAYLRGQADALGLHVLDTSRPIDVTVAELAALAEELAGAADREPQPGYAEAEAGA